MSSQDQTIELRTYFSGLMVFNREKSALEALLVNAREPGKVPGAEGVPPHYAVVQFPWEQAAGDRRPFGKFQDLDGRTQGYWALEGDSLELDPSHEVEDERLDLQTSPRVGREVPLTEEDAASFEWIAPLRGPDGETAVYKQDLAPGGQPRIGGPLIATVRMTRGSVQPAAFASEFKQFVILEFDGKEPQAIASVVRHSVRVKGSSVRLRATKFDGSAGDVLELKPPAGGDGVIEVWVLNREWDQVERQLPAHAVDFGKPNRDYQLFHNLVTNPARELPKGLTRKSSEGVSPNLLPCRDNVMRRLYFPEGSGGEMTLAAPCSPAHTP